MNNNKTIIFFGSPYVAAETLVSLLEKGFSISLVVTNEDKPVGRHQALTSPPAKIIAKQYNIPVFQPKKLDQKAIEHIASYKANIHIVVAYGHIIPQSLLEVPPQKTFNIHYSLLPRWRGAAPVEFALLSGDTETGVTIQEMTYELDAGDIVAQEKITIEPTDTAETLFQKLIPLGSSLLIKTLPLILNETYSKIPQNTKEITRAPKIEKESGDITSIKNDIVKWNMYRAFYLRPGIFFFDSRNKRIKIKSAVFLNNTFTPTRVIPEGEKEQDYSTYITNHGV